MKIVRRLCGVVCVAIGASMALTACGDPSRTDNAGSGVEATTSSTVAGPSTSTTVTTTTSFDGIATTQAPRSSTTERTTTTRPSATTADCPADLVAQVRSRIGAEYIGGSTPVEGGREAGGNGAAGALVHAYGDCRMLTMNVPVRYEGNHQVWRLVEFVALPALHGSEFVHLQCFTKESVDQTEPGDGFVYAAVADSSDPTPGSMRAILAWRVLPERGFESVAPSTVRCQRGDPE